MCTLKFDNFQTTSPLACFQTIEWHHKNNTCKLLPWTPSSFLARTFFMDVPKRVNSKNLKKINQFPILKETIYIFLTYRVVYFFRWHFLGLLYVIMHRHLFRRRQFTKMIWLNLFLLSLHGPNVKSGKKCDMKNFFSFSLTYFKVQVK